MDHRDPAPPSEEPEATAGEVVRRCSLCRSEIPQEFYLLRGLLVCPSCGEAIEKRQAGRGRLRRGFGFGLGCAAGCGLVWYWVTLATGRPLAGLAIVAGIAVGLAVRRGSGGHGGWRYQLAALLLVYATFVGRYVPPVFGGIADAIRREHGATASTTTTTSTSTTTTTSTSRSTTTSTGPREKTSAWATVRAYFVFAVVAWGIVLASPFMPGSASVLALLSLAVGMAVAVRLNRKAQLRGPFIAG